MLCHQDCNAGQENIICYFFASISLILFCGKCQMIRYRAKVRARLTVRSHSSRGLGLFF